MPDGYTYALAEAASEYAFRLPRREQRRLAKVCRLLADTPHRLGAYSTTDEVGRVLQNLTVDDWVITFWTDHAVKEVRIVEVLQI
jgi:hypothetical protein